VGLSLVKPSRESGINRVDLNRAPSLPNICSSYSNGHHVVDSEINLKVPLGRGQKQIQKNPLNQLEYCEGPTGKRRIGYHGSHMNEFGIRSKYYIVFVVTR
jgi:hypothetical protein